MNTTSPTILRRGAAVALAAVLAGGALAVTPAQAAPTGTIRVPNQVVLKAKDFPQRMVLGYDSGQYPNQPAAAGQFCDTIDNGADGDEARPIAGRSWFWWDAATETLGVDQIVTVWDDGAAALADLQNDTGYCRLATYPDAPVLVVTEATLTTFEATLGLDAIASRLVGDTLVSVTVTDFDFESPEVDLTDEAAEAERLADVAAAKVARSKLP